MVTRRGVAPRRKRNRSSRVKGMRGQRDLPDLSGPFQS